MKKLLLVAVLVGVGGYFAYAKVLKPAPKRACDRLAELCGDSGKSDDNSCTEFFDEVGTTEESSKTAECVLAAKSCPEAIGCTAGGAVKLGAGFAKGFLDGFQKSVK
ncbi:MAG TPA: hypothetical protein VN947_34205 [Polyangia bacterium]|nr:hypothetical protein [Polyangia bacterium]